MPFVYFAVTNEPGRVLFGAAEDLSKQLRELKSGNASIRYCRTLQASAAFACARYLQCLYQSRRLLSPADQHWFAIDENEIEHAMRLWELKAEQHDESLRVVEELKQQRASARLLVATESDHRCREDLRRVREQISALQFERECLEAELKLRIGRAAGLQDIARWESREEHRFDLSGFKTLHPDLYERFRRPRTLRYFKLT